MAITVSVMTGGSNSHETTSEEANGLATDFVSEGIIGSYSNTGGVAPATGAFAVNAQGTPDMTVAVSSGVAYVAGTPTSQNSQTFRVYNSASENVTISANSSGSTKYDWVYIKLDATLLANPTLAGTTTATLVTSRSTSSSTDNGTPPTYGYPVAVVTVANGAVSITNATIRDIRTASDIAGNAVLDIENAGAYVPQGYMTNGKIQTSVAANDLTVAIKTLAGTDPTVSNPVYVRIGDTVRSITSALSVTKNDGTNWFNSGSAEHATQDIDYFTYLGYNATDGVVIGFARIPYARTYGDFSATTTNDRYCAISTITNAASTDEYEVVGRFNATLSAGASYNWSIPATSIVISRPIYETRNLSWAPTLSNLSGGTLNYGKYTITGRGLAFRFKYTLAGAGVSGAIGLNLPMVAPSTYSADTTELITGQALFLDTGTASYTGVVRLQSTTQVHLRAQGAAGSYVGGADTSSIVPFTFGNTDVISTSGLMDLV